MSDIEQHRNKWSKGRNARLFYEWDAIDKQYRGNDTIVYMVRKCNPEGLPIVYDIVYNIRSFCGVSEPDEQGLQKPLYADQFTMRITLPNNYPSIDSKLEFRFLQKDMMGETIPYPWHPNIRYFGDFAGRVCLNTEACGTYTDLAWYIDRVACYLRYETYHAEIGVPPFPEDEKVAQWVTEQAIPQRWIEEFRSNN